MSKYCTWKYFSNHIKKSIIITKFLFWHHFITLKTNEKKKIENSSSKIPLIKLSYWNIDFIYLNNNLILIFLHAFMWNNISTSKRSMYKVSCFQIMDQNKVQGFIPVQNRFSNLRHESHLLTNIIIIMTMDGVNWIGSETLPRILIITINKPLKHTASIERINLL